MSQPIRRGLVRRMFALVVFILIPLQVLTACTVNSPQASQIATQPSTQRSTTPATAIPTTAPRPATTAVSTVYAGSDRELVALDAHTGAVRWRYPSRAQVYTIAEGMVYVGVADEVGAVTLLALDNASGAVRWRLPFARGTPPGMVAVQAGVLYTIYAEVANGWLKDRALYALDAKSGRLLWRHSFGVNFISDPIMGTGAIYFLRSDPIDETSQSAGSNLTVYALETRTGSERWRARLDKTDIADVAASGQALYLLGEGIDAGWVYALDLADGHLLYHSFTAILGWSWSPLSLAGRTLYNCRELAAIPPWRPLPHSVITALDAANGQKRWQQDINGACLPALTATAGSTVILMRASEFDGPFTLHLLDERTGVEQRQYEITFGSPTNAIAVPTMRVSQTTLYVEGIDLTVRALNLDTGAPLWQYQLPGENSGDLAIA